jgi:hypothetical protein
MNLKKILYVLVTISLTLTTSTTLYAGDEQLYGTWRLVSFVGKVVATGETREFFGKSPQGLITYGQDGRMQVLIINSKRPKPTSQAGMTDQDRIELFNSTIAYGGTYIYDGKAVKHKIDISWNEMWTGTVQVRQVEFNGNRLILSTAPTPSVVDGKPVTATLTWERVQ